jgi:hypothetical protein
MTIEIPLFKELQMYMLDRTLCAVLVSALVQSPKVDKSMCKKPFTATFDRLRSLHAMPYSNRLVANYYAGTHNGWACRFALYACFWDRYMHPVGYTFATAKRKPVLQFLAPQKSFLRQAVSKRWALPLLNRLHMTAFIPFSVPKRAAGR